MSMVKRLLMFVVAFLCIGAAGPDCGVERKRDPHSEPSSGSSGMYAGTYSIQVRLVVFRRKANGKCWDAFCNDPDPFGTIRIGDQIIRLPATCKDSRFCLWKRDIQEYRVVIKGGEELEISLTDQDVRNDDYIGSCRVAFRPQIEKLRCGQSYISIQFYRQ